MNKELELRKEWLAKARKQTLETLPDFINDILNNNHMSYNLAPYVVGAIASASAWAVNDKIGLTGFQAGFAMWTMIDGWLGESSVGRELIDYEKMLYPQYEDYFTKHTISKYVWENLQKEARNNVIEFIKKDYTEEERNNMTNEQICKTIEDYYKSRNHTIDSDGVLAHQMRILLGEVPFGYTIED